MLKQLLTVSAVALSLFAIGCGVTDPEEATAPTITGPTKVDTLKANSFVQIPIEITAKDTLLTPTTKVTNAAGGAVSTTEISITPQVTDNGVKTKKITYTLTNLAAVAGSYNFEVSATSKGLTSTVKFAFVVAGVPGTPVVTATIMAGANKNSTYGSAIDLDAGVAYKMSNIGTNVPNIDLCYAHTGTGNVDKLGTPEWAIASGYDFAASWTNSVKTMKFYKTSLTVAEFDAITTKEAIPAFDDTKATAISAEAVKGNVFIVKTTEAAVCLLKIDDQVAGEAGTITIKTAK